jgi:hypothetical protein
VLATARTISCFEFAVRRRATPSGSETQSRFALPTQPTQLRALPDGPIHQRQAFRSFLDVLQGLRGNDNSATKNGIKLSSRASQRSADGQRTGHEINYEGHRMRARIEGGQGKSLTRTGLDWCHRYKRTIEAAPSLEVESANLDGKYAR